MKNDLDSLIENFSFAEDIKYSGFENIIPEMLYLYLFEGESLRSIDDKIIGTDKMKGWFSKVLLNYVGVKTETEHPTKGIFKRCGYTEVLTALQRHGTEHSLRIAYYLSLYRNQD